MMFRNKLPLQLLDFQNHWEGDNAAVSLTGNGYLFYIAAPIEELGEEYPYLEIEDLYDLKYEDLGVGRTVFERLLPEAELIDEVYTRLAENRDEMEITK
jgi:hypothetical protein